MNDKEEKTLIRQIGEFLADDEVDEFNKQLKSATKKLTDPAFKEMTKEIMKIYFMQMLTTEPIIKDYIKSQNLDEETETALNFINIELESAYYNLNYYQDLKDDKEEYKDLFRIDKRIIKLDEEAKKELDEELKEMEEENHHEIKPNA